MMNLVLVMFLAGCFATVCTVGLMHILLTNEREELGLEIGERRETLRLNVSKKQN
jgi:hypothetical protein